MKKITTCFLAVFAIAAIATAQTPAEQKAWEAFMTPGETHAMFAKFDGTWNTAVKTWMEPGKPPVESKGTAENKMILGGGTSNLLTKGILWECLLRALAHWHTITSVKYSLVPG